MVTLPSSHSNEICQILYEQISKWIGDLDYETAKNFNDLMKNAMKHWEIIPLGKISLSEKSKANHFPFTGLFSIDENTFESLSTWINSIFLGFRNSEHQSKIGQVFTPIQIVKQIIDRIQTILTEEMHFEQDSIYLCDFACGPGHFINYYLWTQLNSHQNTTNLTDVFKNLSQHLYTFDIDPAACFSTYVIALIICTVYLYQKELQGIIPNLIEQKLYPPIKIFHQDYLQNNSNSFPKFDVIVGNPPYIFARNLSVQYRKQLLQWNYQTAKGQYDLSDVFIEQAIKNSSMEGLVGVIIPETIQTLENRRNVRSIIIKQAERLEINHVKTPFYQKSVSNIILLVKKRAFLKSQNESSNHITFQIDDDPPIQYDFHKIEQQIEHYLIPRDSILQDALTWIKQNYYSIDEWNVLHPDEEFQVFRGIELSKKGIIMQCPSCNKWMPFSDTKKNCFFCQNTISPETVHQTSIIHKLINSQQKLTPNQAFFIDSFSNDKHKQNYTLSKEIVPTHLIELNYKGIQYKNQELYTTPRILVRQILQSKKLCTAIAPEKCLTSQSIYNIIIPKRFLTDLDKMITWLQEPHVSYYNYQTFSKGKDLFARILLGKLKQLPWIPRNITHNPNVTPELKELFIKFE